VEVAVPCAGAVGADGGAQEGRQPPGWAATTAAIWRGAQARASAVAALAAGVGGVLPQQGAAATVSDTQWLVAPPS
jgi:hypothetical protein